MKIDITELKENYSDLEKYRQIMSDDEKHGRFTHDQDVVNPDTYYPVDESFPYIRKGLKWSVIQAIYNKALYRYTRQINATLTNLTVTGTENLLGVGAAIVTCNHISKVDSFAVRGALDEPIMYVAAEHNNWKGPFGELARNTGYLPLPKPTEHALMRKFNKAIEYYLNKGKKILFYPEQAMWREYTKPRPLQIGAFHYAASYNVPILPMFITLTPNKQPIDEKGRANYSDYTIHVLPPIYPNKDKSLQENKHKMKEENFRLWKELYETVYSKELRYDI